MGTLATIQIQYVVYLQWHFILNAVNLIKFLLWFAGIVQLPHAFYYYIAHCFMFCFRLCLCVCVYIFVSTAKLLDAVYGRIIVLSFWHIRATFAFNPLSSNYIQQTKIVMCVCVCLMEDKRTFR